MTNNQRKLFFIVKESMMDSIRPSTRFPGQMESSEWVMADNRCQPGDVVGFTHKWCEPTHTQGIVTGKVKVGKRWVIFFTQTDKPIDVANAGISNKYSEKNYVGH
jgi:hypothetical protein